jgi:isopenicillin N synthase-like dioxygenase
VSVGSGEVPVVDLAPFRSGGDVERGAVAAELDEAYREVGFASIVGHGVDPGLCARMMEVTAEFFALPSEEKARSISTTRHPNRGYQPMGNESLSRSYAGAEGDAPPDLFEAFTIGPVDRPSDDYHRAPAAGRFFEANDWPSDPDSFAAVWTEYYRALEEVADLVMEVFARALGLPEGYFVDSTDRHITALRSLHYPPTDVEPLPGQMRIGQHTDFGSITVLLTDDTPGLQVATGEGPDPEWIDVPHVPGALVVNVGDLLSEWSNGRWRSTRHRVAPVALDRHRTSWAFFHHPNYDAVIQCLPECDTGAPPVLAEPVTAGDYLWRKLDALTL